MNALSAFEDSAAASPTVGQAVVLGLVQGPAELLPVSSSAHAIALPALADWNWRQVDPGLRKDLEVALHAGSVLVLAAPWLKLLVEEVRGCGSLSALALAIVPAAAAGYLGEDKIAESAEDPAIVAAGLAAGGIALFIASRSRRRRRGPLTPADGLALGLAQAAALIPGLSRSGSTVTAARGVGFGPGRAGRISAAVGLPVVAGAALLKGARLATRLKRGEANHDLPVLAAGAAASVLSTAIALRLIGPAIRTDKPGLVLAYRLALAALLAKGAAGDTPRRPPPG